MNLKTTFPLTVIMVQDEVDKGYTTFFAQFPNIIAEGKDEEEATNNLFVLVKDVFEHQKNEEIEIAKSHIGSPEHFFTKSYDCAIA